MAATRTQRGGFTLVEVLVALAILLIGIGAVMLLFPLSLSQARKAAERTITSQTAQSVVGQIRASTAEELFAGNLPQGLLTQAKTAANIYGYTTTVQRMGANPEVFLQRVTLTVTLSDGSTETFTTFVSRR